MTIPLVMIGPITIACGLPAAPLHKLDWRRLMHLTDEELGQYDVGAVNLAAADGLPGAEAIDHDLCIRTLDHWADRVRAYTDRCFHQFLRNPYQDSEAYFRVLCLVTELQLHIGATYNPAKMPADAPFDTADTFIHGIIQGDGGTCATMPVVIAAIGRRLGYPIKLVDTYQHFFCRWDEGPGGERFNIEAAGNGLSCFPDGYYMQWPKPITPDLVKYAGFLRSLSPRQELASFFSQRGSCWVDLERWSGAAMAFAIAFELDREVPKHEFLALQAMDKWREQIRERVRSPHFPKLDIGLGPRFFTGLKPEVEKALIGMKLTEYLLEDLEMDKKWWSRLRDYPKKPPAGMPKRFKVDYFWGRPVYFVPQHQ